MKVSEDILQEVQADWKQIPVPYNIQMSSVISVQADYDTMLVPNKACMTVNQSLVSEITQGIDAKYEKILKKFTTQM